VSTATLEYVETRTSDVAAESSHIVMVPPGEKDETPHAYVLRARIEGFPVEALCGHTWVPHQNPAPLPVCETCLNIYQNDPFAGDSREDLPNA
jgi:hypothetical protein